METQTIVCKIIKWVWRIVLGMILGFLAFKLWDEIQPIGWKNILFFWIGFVALCYSLVSLRVWLFCPIKRDWILVRGKFFRRVFFFVISVPIVLTLILMYSYKNKLHAHELIYAPELTANETIYIPQEISSLRNGMEITSYNDTIQVKYRDVRLLDTIYGKENLLKNFSFWEKILHEDVMKVEDVQKDGEKQLGIIYRKGLAVDSIGEQTGPGLLWTVFYHFIDPGNQHMTTTDRGRYWALGIALLGVVLMNGLLVSTMISWIDRRKERWTNGEVRYGFWGLLMKKYAVVIGANESAPTIIRDLIRGKGECPNIDYVILQTNGDVEEARRKISSYLKDDERKKLIVYNGQLDSIEEMYNLRIKNATEVYVLGEDSEEDVSHSYHDTQNMKCVHNIASYLADRYVVRRIVCRVLFEYQTTYSVFQFSEIPEIIRQRLVFIPFNNYENWAQRVLVKGEYTEKVKKVLPMPQKTDFVLTLCNKVKYFIVNHIQAYMSKENEEDRKIDYLPLEGCGGIPEYVERDGEKKLSDKYVHLVVIGMSKMGVAMAIQAAQVAHFPNFKASENPRRTRITFIDPNADDEMNFFKGRFRNLFDLSRSRYIDATVDDLCLSDLKWEDPMSDESNPYSYLGPNFIDIEWEFVKGRVEQPSVRKYLELISASKTNSERGNSVLTVAVCLPLAHEAVAACLYMPPTVYDYAQQIWVYQREASDIIYNLYYTEENTNKRYEKLRPFGMQYADFTMDKDNYYRAQLCNYVYELMFSDTISNDVINAKISEIKDASDKTAMKSAREFWKKLSIFNRWSNRYLANSFETKLRSVGCYLANYLLHYDKVCVAFEKHAEMLAECEHNRWNVQQLLMGFRAYTRGDLTDYERCENKKEFKDKMKKGKEKAHLNICSFAHLDEVEKRAKEYDKVFNNAIPVILKLTEVAKMPKEQKKKLEKE